MNNIKQLETRIQDLEKRNKIKDTNKTWETSLTRKILIAIFTYLTVSLYFSALGVNNSWLNALVPTAGFLLSTLTLPWFKQLWIKYIYNKK